MLCLSRKKSEEIIVTTTSGEVIRIVVVDVRGDRVRIGVEAPKEVSITRKELIHDADNQST